MIQKWIGFERSRVKVRGGVFEKRGLRVAGVILITIRGAQLAREGRNARDEMEVIQGVRVRREENFPRRAGESPLSLL